MARISLTQVFVNADDSPALNKDTNKPFDLRWALVQICLLEVDAEGQPVRGEKKMRRYELFRKVKKATDIIELKAEDIALLKEGALALTTLIAGQTREMLENHLPPVAVTVPDDKTLPDRAP